jgi:hypothetical protein
VTISNTSTTVSLDNVALTASAGFKVSGNTCGTAVAAGASCTADIVFAPTNIGSQTGTLTIASSTLGANVSVQLSGTGFDFTVATAGAGSQSVASGQTANYTLTLTPSGGVPQSFSFLCNSLPAYAACLYNPSTNNVAATATGTETIQVTTSQTTGRSVPAKWKPGWIAVALAGGFLLLPVATRKRRKLLAEVAFLVLIVAGVSSCAGSGGGGGASPSPTPTSHDVAPGTYSIPLVVTSGSVQHTVTLTLVVD